MSAPTDSEKRSSQRMWPTAMAEASAPRALPAGGRRMLLRLILLLLLAVVAFSALTHIDRVVSAPGQLVAIEERKHVVVKLEKQAMHHFFAVDVAHVTQRIGHDLVEDLGYVDICHGDGSLETPRP